MCNTLWKRMAFFEWKKNWNEPLPLEPSPPLMVTHIKSSSSTDSLFLPDNKQFRYNLLTFCLFFCRIPSFKGKVLFVRRQTLFCR